MFHLKENQPQKFIFRILNGNMHTSWVDDILIPQVAIQEDQYNFLMGLHKYPL